MVVTKVKQRQVTIADGIVDVQNLIVLSEHLFEEIPPVQ